MLVGSAIRQSSALVPQQAAARRLTLADG